MHAPALKIAGDASRHPAMRRRRCSAPCASSHASGSQSDRSHWAGHSRGDHGHRKCSRDSPSTGSHSGYAQKLGSHTARRGTSEVSRLPEVSPESASSCAEALRSTARSATPRLAGRDGCESTDSNEIRRQCSCSKASSSTGSLADGAATPRDENEYCSCCSMEVFWTAYDIFHAMDGRRANAITRSDYFGALRQLGAGLDFRRLVKRAALHDYFRGTAQELRLQEFISRVFPCLTPADVELLGTWTLFRKAWHLVNAESFRASGDNLQQLFDILTGVSSCKEVGAFETRLPISFLTRARILSERETKLALTKEVRSWLTFEEFSQYFQAVLSKKYVKAESPKIDFTKVFSERLHQSRAPSADSTMELHLDDAEPLLQCPMSVLKASSPKASMQARPRGLPRLPGTACRPRVRGSGGQTLRPLRT